MEPNPQQAGQKPQRDEEYELVPLSPIRRIEKRVERIEHAGVPTESVATVVKINTEMIRCVADLTARVNDLIAHMQITEPGGKGKEFESKIEDRLDKLEKRLNALIIATMPRRPRPAMPGPMM